MSQRFTASAPERDRLARATEAETRAHPDEVRSADTALRKFLAGLAKDQPLQRADLREQRRLKFEKLAADDVPRRMDRTDPVVGFDQSKNRLITGTLAAWRRAGVWMAGFLSVPQPAGDFVANQRAYVKAHYAALPMLSTMTANIGRSMRAPPPMMVPAGVP
jgi:hypothetical protein